MSSHDYGFLDNPANGLGIVRARTLIGNLRSWELPRSEQALAIIINEIGRSPIPGLYILFDSKSKKVYIGQTESIKHRLTTHIKTPESKIKNWDRAIVINDGRNATQSDFNDENIRLTLENYLVKLFKINRYNVTTAATRSPSLSATQKTWVNTFKDEIIVLLTRKSKINKVLTERGDDEINNDDAKKIIRQKGHTIQKWGKLNAQIDAQRTFIRPGSKKPAGWQVTFRGSKPNSFKTNLAQGEGFLLMPRGPLLLIPLEVIKKFVQGIDTTVFKRDTIDIFLHFDEQKIALVYKKNELDITDYTVQTFP